MKAKEREMKEEKENERQVNRLHFPLDGTGNADCLLTGFIRNT